MSPYPEELLCRARVQCPVGYLCLLGQVLCALYGRHHPLHGEESSQVGRVRGDDDKGEEPPHPSDNTSRQRPGEKTDGGEKKGTKQGRREIKIKEIKGKNCR